MTRWMSLILYCGILFVAFSGNIGCENKDSLAQLGITPRIKNWITVPSPVSGITYNFTAPINDNLGTCEKPIYKLALNPMRIKWRWVGLVYANSGEGSLVAMPGDSCSITISSKAESLWVWAERDNSFRCDTMVIVRSKL